MSTTIQIPGGTAEILSIDDLSVRKRRSIQKSFQPVANIYARLPQEFLDVLRQDEDSEEKRLAQSRIPFMIAALELSPDDMEALLGQQDASIIAFLKSWSLPQQLPTLETVQDLSLPLYDALATATAKPSADVINGIDLSVTPPGVDSPFGDSGISKIDSTIPETPVSE